MDLVRRFPATRHSALTAMRSGDGAGRARGLATLSAVYWRPVYSYLRLRWRKPHEEAADLAQEFFAELLEKDLLSRFDPSRARLRTYLRVCIDGLVSNHDKAQSREKRGGGAALPFDFETAREELERVAGSAESMESLFEKEWARGVFAIALQRLREACAKAGRADRYALLEQYDLADSRPTYAELAEQFGIAVTDVTNRLFRIRRELRQVVLDVLRELTASEEEFLEEARALLGKDAA
ncbi:MAG TPA: sigma-70 family RNA polymerase sigma factor [Myxococcales bacterium]|jgi:RNA polymerase sigma factor (sigma-70 family)|nr:sigma-70 family RNA polymerase sigma factor [Myxococcales bacterium]